MAAKAPKRRTRLDPKQRRSLILDHAAEIVARDGVAALSMDLIAKSAGISKSLVYNYFPNLSELLSELLERELRHLRKSQSIAAEGATTFDELVRGITHAYLAYIDERGLLIERLQSEPSVSAMHDPTEYGRDAAVDYLAEIIGRHFDLPDEVARAATEISFGLPASAGSYLLRHDMTREQVEDVTVTMIVGSIMALKNEYVLKLQRLRAD